MSELVERPRGLGGKRVAAVVAILVLLLVGPLTGAAFAAPQQPAQESTGPLTLRLDELAPRVVTAEGPSMLTVSGVLANTGDDTVGAIGVRLQRGQPLTTEGAVRDALEGSSPTDATSPQFQELPDTLAPGEEVPIRLSVPLRGAPEATLALSTPGTYELLVNVNGMPVGGDRARLAAVRMLLPVIGLPAGPDGADAVPTADAAAVPFSLLYPVVDVPRRLSTVPGEPVLLTDDTLADTLAPTGRLGGLVTALAATAPVGSPVRNATCVAVDPDLLQTASRMTEGYLVLRADGALVPGRGAETAAAWLAGFAAAARGGCVLALPFADADVVALTRSGLADNAVAASDAGREIAADLLGTAVLPSTAWPADGVVDEATLTALTASGLRSLVLSADGVDLPTGADPAGVVPVAGFPATVAVLSDPLVTAAAGGRLAGSAAVTGSGRAADATSASGPLATQDTLGAVTFRVTEDPPAGSPLVIAPPHRWAADGTAGAALLDGLGRLVDAGLLTPRALADLAAAGAPADAGSRVLDYPLSAGRREVPPAAVASVASVLADVADLRSSVVEDDLGVDPDDVFGPLLLGAVRPASAAWRGEPGLAAAAAAMGERRVDEIRGSVTVLEPPTPFSLGASESPLLLTVVNGLPVTMRVRVEVASTSGLRVAPIPAVEIPPLGRRQIQASAEVLRSGVFTVDAAVRTQNGGLLGPPSRLQVRSTAYGTITLWLTGTAGVLLVVLAARRIVRRVRTEPGRHTGPEPRPGAPELIPHTAETPVPPERDGPGVTSPGTPTRPTPAPRTTASDGLGPTVPVRMPSPPRSNAPPSSPPASNAPTRPGPRTGQSPPVPSARTTGDAGPRPGPSTPGPARPRPAPVPRPVADAPDRPEHPDRAAGPPVPSATRPPAATRHPTVRSPQRPSGRRPGSR